MLADQVGDRLLRHRRAPHRRLPDARPPTSCSPRSPRARPASASAPPSPCSAPTIPVRVFQRYSTLDAVSGGRAEVILGRGSSIESFPLFGYDLADYEELFEEKTNLFAELMKGGPVTWQGTTRAPLRDQDVVPHLESGRFPVWVGVGGSPESVIRAAHYGFSLMLAIIGGPPARFAPFSELYREASSSSGSPPGRSASTRRATSPRPTSRPGRSSGRTTGRCSTRFSKDRGFATPTEESLQARIGPRRRALRRLARDRRAQDRADLGARSEPLRPEVRHAGPLPRPADDRIELYGTQVIPRVRELVGDDPIAAQPVTGAPPHHASETRTMTSA